MRLQGLEIKQVEILSGKELTNLPEVSFELLLVTAVAKRKQRDILSTEICQFRVIVLLHERKAISRAYCNSEETQKFRRNRKLE